MLDKPPRHLEVRKGAHIPAFPPGRRTGGPRPTRSPRGQAPAGSSLSLPAGPPAGGDGRARPRAPPHRREPSTGPSTPQGDRQRVLPWAWAEKAPQTVTGHRSPVTDTVVRKASRRGGSGAISSELGTMSTGKFSKNDGVSQMTRMTPAEKDTKVSPFSRVTRKDGEEEPSAGPSLHRRSFHPREIGLQGRAGLSLTLSSSPLSRGRAGTEPSDPGPVTKAPVYRAQDDHAILVNWGWALGSRGCHLGAWSDTEPTPTPSMPRAHEHPRARAHAPPSTPSLQTAKPGQRG